MRLLQQKAGLGLEAQMQVARQFSFACATGFHCRWNVVLVGAIVLAALLICPQSASACPNFKDSLAGQGGDLQFGFALSIVLMLSTPIAILAFWTFWLVRFLHAEVIPLPDRASIGRPTC